MDLLLHLISRRSCQSTPKSQSIDVLLGYSSGERRADGNDERGNHPVIRLSLLQWILNITEYADLLEAGLVGLACPSATKTAQQQWLGEPTGCEVEPEVRFIGMY